jgi:hypothetical protein
MMARLKTLKENAEKRRRIEAMKELEDKHK